MPTLNPNLWMFVVPFAGNLWWTNKWLLGGARAKWRHAMAAFVSALLWLFLAFASTRVVAASGGKQFTYGSAALSYFCVFMGLVSVIGILLGLFLWTEEEADETRRELPNAISTRFDR